MSQLRPASWVGNRSEIVDFEPFSGPASWVGNRSEIVDFEPFSGCPPKSGRNSEGDPAGWAYRPLGVYGYNLAKHPFPSPPDKDRGRRRPDGSAKWGGGRPSFPRQEYLLAISISLILFILSVLRGPSVQLTVAREGQDPGSPMPSDSRCIAKLHASAGSGLFCHSTLVQKPYSQVIFDNCG